MASTNPANFANRPTEEVKAIASMGGKASHESNENDSHLPGRNPDGTFVQGSEAAKEAGHLGGLHSHQNDDEKKSSSSGRNPDGTFVKGSEEAKLAGHVGGLHTAGKTDVNELDVQAGPGQAGRNADGTFVKGSEAAKEAGHKGGAATAAAA